jgi:hypothetical protein
VRCWRSVPWWRQNFGAWSAATISRRDRLNDTAGKARATDFRWPHGNPLQGRCIVGRHSCRVLKLVVC